MERKRLFGKYLRDYTLLNETNSDHIRLICPKSENQRPRFVWTENELRLRLTNFVYYHVSIRRYLRVYRIIHGACNRSEKLLAHIMLRHGRRD